MRPGRYGEATLPTAEKLLRILHNLTSYVPAMAGWDGPWNLNADATFLDIGSGYGKVVLHAKIVTGCRLSRGIECVAKRVEISNLAAQVTLVMGSTSQGMIGANARLRSEM